MEEKAYNLMGVEIALGSREELLMRVAALLGKGGAVCTVNPEILTLAKENHRLRCHLRTSLNIPDGVGVRAALRIRGIKTDTLPGVELGELLLDTAPVRLGIVGGREGIAEAALSALCHRHPKAVPALAASGYGKRYAEYREMIKNSRSDVIYVCLGCPLQEHFISHMRECFPTVLFIGLGGSADIYSGAIRRAPRIFRALGAEWLYRTLREPRRIFRLPRLFRFATEALFHKSADNFGQNNRKNADFSKKLRKFDKF